MSYTLTRCAIAPALAAVFAMGAVPATAQDVAVGRFDKVPSGAYAVVAEVRARPGKEKELRDATLPLVAEVRREPGNLLYFLHEDREAPGHFIFYEIFASQAEFEVSRHQGLPAFLLGHSAGGVISCLYVLEHEQELSGLICESVAFELPAPDVAIAALRGLSHVAPHAHVLQLKNEHLSRDPDLVRAMNEDPLIAQESQAARTVAELARADDRLREEFGRITLPLFILHGTVDQATRPSGSQTFHAAAGSSDKTLKLFEGHYLYLLNDLGREVVLADILAWIKARLSPSAP